MKKIIKRLIEEALTTSKSTSCDCGCGGCGKAPILKESKISSLISEGLQHHIDKKIPLHECEYRSGSEEHLTLIREARKLYSRGLIDVSESDKALLESNLGHFGEYKGEIVPLDLPILSEEAKKDIKIDFDTILQFVKDPDDAEAEYERYIEQGLDGLSDMLRANIDRLNESKTYHVYVKEGSEIKKNILKRTKK